MFYIVNIQINKIIDFNIPTEDSDLEMRIFKSSQEVENGYGNSHKDVIFDFIDSITTDKEPIITARSTLETIRSIHAIYKSVETGKWIKVDERHESSLLGN